MSKILIDELFTCVNSTQLVENNFGYLNRITIVAAGKHSCRFRIYELPLFK
jgi:hypothetical protein